VQDARVVQGETNGSSLTRAQVREVDRLAIEELGMPGMLLMENAGLGAAHHVGEVAGERGARVAVLCGGGNNGGDGYVIARHLANAAFDVLVCECVEPGLLAGDAGLNREIVRRMGIPRLRVTTGEELAAVREELARAGVLVDALLGTGFHGAVRPHLARVIEAVNAARARADEGRARVVAIDLPSGLDCDLGEPSNATIRADLTVTFVARKRGFDRPGSQEWTGRVVVVPIGAPPGLAERVRCS